MRNCPKLNKQTTPACSLAVREEWAGSAGTDLMNKSWFSPSFFGGAWGKTHPFDEEKLPIFVTIPTPGIYMGQIRQTLLVRGKTRDRTHTYNKGNTVSGEGEFRVFISRLEDVNPAS